MKKNILILVGSVLIIALIVLFLFLFLYKGPKNFSFTTTDLDRITLQRESDQEVSLEPHQFEAFLQELNGLKFKEKNTGVKTKGSFFIRLTYKDELVVIGKYSTYFTSLEQTKFTLFKDDFQVLALTYLYEKTLL